MLGTATITYDLADMLGVDFDARRTKVWVTTNVPSETVVDTDANKIRLGSGNGTISEDGTGSVTVWTPGTGANPASWQTYIHVAYPDRNTPRGRAQRTFGPFTITASADLADLVEQQEMPPEYIVTVTSALSPLVSSAQAAATAAAGSETSAAASAAAAATITGLTGEDDAVALLAADPSTRTGKAIGDTMAQALGAYLDIWDPYNAGSSDTYAAFMSYIDGLFASAVAAGTVTRTDHGAGSDSNHIYSFTAGATRAPHMLLLGGSHGDESLSMKAAMRWFQQFAIGTHPAMVALRSQLRVTWIPVVTPSGYRSSRQNANLVNVPRNYDFYWTHYNPPTTASNKGTAAFSEPESQVVKGLCDTFKIAALVDCHTIASSDSTGAVALLEPSAFIAHNYDLAYAAVSRWEQTYDDAGYGWRQLGADYRSVPTAASWAAKYLRITKGRFNAAAITVESPESWSGSTMNSITRKGIRDYCGYITLWVREWLLHGQASIVPAPFTLYAQRQETAASGTNIVDGGTRVAGVATWQAVRFTTYDEYTTDPGGARNYIDVPIIYPGSLVVTVSGYALVSADTASGQITSAIGMKDAPAAGVVEDTSSAALGNQSTSNTPVDVPASRAVGDRVTFNYTDRYGFLAADVGKVKRIRVLFNKVGGWVGPDVLRLRLQVQYFPGEIHSSGGPLRLPVRKSVDGI